MAGRERLFFGYVAGVGIAALSLSAPFLADLPGVLADAPAALCLGAGLALAAGGIGWCGVDQALVAAAGWLRAPRARERPGVVAEEALAMGAVLLLGVLAVYASALVLVPLYVASRMARLAAQRHRY